MLWEILLQKHPLLLKKGEVRHIGIEMAPKPDPKTVRLGHSHVLNVQLKDTTLLHAAGELLVVLGATVVLHLKSAHMQQVARTRLKTVPHAVPRRTLSTIMLVISLTSWAPHQSRAVLTL